MKALAIIGLALATILVFSHHGVMAQQNCNSTSSSRAIEIVHRACSNFNGGIFNLPRFKIQCCMQVHAINFTCLCEYYTPSSSGRAFEFGRNCGVSLPERCEGLLS
ncbi:hypothetical protein ACJIZ3_023346 [Penstemon smallii]|uniref:Bifunctional inhibitor/plant lipid transfer protein/seed storage helical domain-containing protein n=1 Tax=Penstemon smallii TaxID=265156 RepID=A0ABD3TPV2_9LAMI